MAAENACSCLTVASAISLPLQVIRTAAVQPAGRWGAVRGYDDERGDGRWRRWGAYGPDARPDEHEPNDDEQDAHGP